MTRRSSTASPDDFKYREYMTAIRDTCKELGLVAYLPNYHGDRDANTVLIYYPEDAEYNSKLEADCPAPWTPRQEEYRKYLLCLQNTDVNGHYSPYFANRGTIDLRPFDAKKRLAGAIRLAYLTDQQYRYVRF